MFSKNKIAIRSHLMDLVYSHDTQSEGKNQRHCVMPKYQQDEKDFVHITVEKLFIFSCVLIYWCRSYENNIQRIFSLL